MRPSSAKAKGRRLQVELAEALSVRLGLTIEATPPTKPGVREASGAVYVPVHSFPDLRVKRMGEAGADVELLTPKAASYTKLDGHPIWWECKNVERGADFNAAFWRSGRLPLLDTAFEQADASRPPQSTVAVVFSRNHYPILVAWRARELHTSVPHAVLQSGDHLVVVATLMGFMEHAFGK